MGELILRPMADAKNEDMQYSSGSSGYLLVNEETADDDATYIYGAYTDTTNVKRVYYGTVQPITLDKRIKVTSLKMFTRCKTTKGKSNDSAQYRVIVYLYPNGSPKTSYSAFTEDYSVSTSWNTYNNTFDPSNFHYNNNNTDDIIFNPGYYTNFGSLGVADFECTLTSLEGSRVPVTPRMVMPCLMLDAMSFAFSVSRMLTLPLPSW